MKTELKDGINIEELIKGFKRATDILKMEKPNFILAPVSGAVPFIDILNIIDRHFRLDSVVYIPNSSRFENREELMKEWYSKFYESYEVGEPLKLICVDEVLSGSSAVGGYRQFQKSIEERARRKARGLSDESVALEKFQKKLNKQVSYKILGIAEKGYDRDPEFNRLINKKLVYLFEFDSVPTIDNMQYNPIRFKTEKILDKNRTIYHPEVEKFEVTPEYLALLRNIAAYVGVDPSKVNPVNFAKIEDGLKQARKKD